MDLLFGLGWLLLGSVGGKDPEVVGDALQGVGKVPLAHVLGLEGNPLEEGLGVELELLLLLLDPLDLGDDGVDLLAAPLAQALFLDAILAVYGTTLHASTVSQTIPDIHGSSQIFPASEGMSF